MYVRVRTDTINKYNEPLFKLVLWFVFGRGLILCKRSVLNSYVLHVKIEIGILPHMSQSCKHHSVILHR